MFKILYAFLWLITWLPLSVLYLFSDFFYLIIYYIVGYRKKIVQSNLKKSFPEKSEKELIEIEKKFYHYFCDLFIEVAYQIHMNEDEMKSRMKFSNLDLITDQYKNNKSVMLMTAHYCNWEWTTSMSLFLPKGKPLNGIYKQLSSKSFDKFMCDLRAKYNGTNIETQDLFRTILQKRNSNEFCTYGMISDQTPSNRSSRYWLTFLNQDTSVLIGTEELARKFNYPVVFMNLERVKRGYYSCEIIMIEADPKNTTKHEITEKYMHILEEKINAQPEYWLWTHRRWKLIKPTE